MVAHGICSPRLEVDRDDIYGDGVNVAARLESLAEPGGVCISGAVFDAMGQKLPLDYQFLGEQRGRSRTSDRHGWRECRRIAGAIPAMCFAAPAHLTAMDGGNAIGLQEQSLPCAMGVHKIARVAGLRKRFWGSPQRRRARSGAVAVGVVIDSQTLSPTYEGVMVSGGFFFQALQGRPIVSAARQ